MAYVDGYVLPLPKKNTTAYTKMAKLAGKIWLEHGALAYWECVGDDMKSHEMCGDFKTMAGLKTTETVVFAFVVYKNKAHRDKVNKKVMADKRLEAGCDPQNMPFNPKRMAYGGFKPLVALGKVG